VLEVRQHLLQILGVKDLAATAAGLEVVGLAPDIGAEPAEKLTPPLSYHQSTP
jgi:hypothetical protein